MVKQFICKGSGSHMAASKVGHWVSMEDYIKVRRLLRTCAESMRDWAVNAREEIAEVDDAAQEMFDALEDM